MYLVPSYKGALCKEPFIKPLEWAVGEKRFDSSPLVSTPRHGPELKSVREILVLVILHGLNSALPYLVSTNHSKTPLTLFPGVSLLYSSFLIQCHVHLLYSYHSRQSIE